MYTLSDLLTQCRKSRFWAASKLSWQNHRFPLVHVLTLQICRVQFLPVCTSFSFLRIPREWGSFLKSPLSRITSLYKNLHIQHHPKLLGSVGFLLPASIHPTLLFSSVYPHAHGALSNTGQFAFFLFVNLTCPCLFLSRQRASLFCFVGSDLIMRSLFPFLISCY